MSLPARDLAPCHQSPESFSGITTLPGLSEMRGQSTLRRDSLSWSVPFSGKPTNRQSDWRTLARLPGLIVVCFGRFWVRGLPFPNARHLGHPRSEEHTSELQSRGHLVCRLLLEKKKTIHI